MKFIRFFFLFHLNLLLFLHRSCLSGKENLKEFFSFVFFSLSFLLPGKSMQFMKNNFLLLLPINYRVDGKFEIENFPPIEINAEEMRVAFVEKEK